MAAQEQKPGTGLSEGEFEIILGKPPGAKFVLRPTLEAFKVVNSRFGGFNAALQALSRGDADSLTYIVAAGLGKTIADVEGLVFEAGIRNLFDPVGEYVERLTNGGRKVTKDQREQEAKKAAGEA